MDKLPPTPGAWAEHIRRAHLQASIWSQDIILDPVNPDPLTLGWKEEDDKLMPVLSRESPAPDCLLQLVKCACGASSQSSVKCTTRCSCKKHKLACTELCHCGGKRTFVPIHLPYTQRMMRKLMKMRINASGQKNHRQRTLESKWQVEMDYLKGISMVFEYLLHVSLY